MSASTTPILLTGGTTMFAEYLGGKGVDYRVALGTGIAAFIFSLAENLNSQLFTGIAWLAFVGSLIITHPDGINPMTEFTKKWSTP
jgi:hypothetical protein